MQKIDHHRVHMRRAIDISLRGLGKVSPNPAVGCVIVSNDNNIIAEGYHHECGGVHAEVDALTQLDDIPYGSTMYVTLEPCSIHGRTPACTDRIMASGLKSVVIGMTDPNPLVNGDGISRLKAQGINVVTGVLRNEIEYLNRNFTKWVREKIPRVIVKLAQSSDRYISADTNTRTTISGKEARIFTHRLRAVCDGVLIGKNTAVTDDPELTVRDVEGRNPIRFIADTHCNLPRHLKIFRDQQAETIILSSERTVESHQTSYSRVLQVSEHREKLLPDDMLKKIAETGVTRLLIEGGAELVSRFMTDGLVDEIYLITSGEKLIKKGVANPIKLTTEWQLIDTQASGSDTITHFEKKV